MLSPENKYQCRAMAWIWRMGSKGVVMRPTICVFNPWDRLHASFPHGNLCYRRAADMSLALFSLLRFSLLHVRIAWRGNFCSLLCQFIVPPLSSTDHAAVQQTNDSTVLSGGPNNPLLSLKCKAENPLANLISNKAKNSMDNWIHQGIPPKKANQTE